LETGIKKNRPRKKIPVFPLTCSKILGLEGRKKVLLLKIFLASKHVSRNTGIFFLGLFFFIPVSKTDVPDFCVSFLGKNWGLI
jgi:hypothetical protein